MIYIYCLFPESDDDLLLYACDNSLPQKMSESLLFIRKYLRDNNLEYKFCYDSQNLKNFFSKVADIQDCGILSKVHQQVASVFRTCSLDVFSQNRVNPHYSYWLWNKPAVCVEPNNCIVFQNLELKETECVLSFRSEDLRLLPTLNLLVDATHLPNLPKLGRVEIFASEYSCIDWLKSFVDCSFHLINNSNYQKMPFMRGPKSYYKELSTGHYWCYDYFHKDNRQHYEVFNGEGIHISEADNDGHLIPNSADSAKTIKSLLK